MAKTWYSPGESPHKYRFYFCFEEFILRSAGLHKGGSGPRNGEFAMRGGYYSHLCHGAISRKRYLLRSGNTNRSQLKSAIVTKVDTRSGPFYLFPLQLVEFCWTADCCRMRITESSHAIDFLPYAQPAARLTDTTDASLDSILK